VGRGGSTQLANPLTNRRATPRVVAPAVCSTCSDTGVLRTAPGHAPAEWSAVQLRSALDVGKACLCTCEAGQWWLSWMLDVCRDRVPERGVPDGLVRDARWMDGWIERKRGIQ
jgi:hypothetical protein